MNYEDAIDYLSTEIGVWEEGANKTTGEEALSDLANGTELQKVAAISHLNDLYWDCGEITSKLEFGQALYTVSYTVDPSRPSPFIRHA